MKQRFNKLTLELCKTAVLDCFKNKWKRNDVLTFVEKYAGICRWKFWKAELDNDPTIKYTAAEAIAPVLYGIVEDISRGIYPDDDIVPVIVKKKPDGMTGKIRDIATLCVMHQLLGHIAKLMIDPLLRMRIELTQHASIPGRGQTNLKNQTCKMFRKHPEIKHAQKTDVKSAYKNTKYSVAIGIIEKEIPKAKTVIKLLKYLATLAPLGHLIIGGYLDAWLFNFCMSYAIRFLKTIGKVRRGKFLSYCKKCETYMDDFSIYGSSASDIKKCVKALRAWFMENENLEIKTTSGIIHLLPISEEHRRNKLKNSQKGCPSVDMAGYKICRTHVKIRRRVFRKSRRQFLRAWRELKRDGTLRLHRAEKVISYNSYVKQSDSKHVIEKYHLNEILRVAKQVVGFHERLRTAARKEWIQNAVQNRGR